MDDDVVEVGCEAVVEAGSNRERALVTVISRDRAGLLADLTVRIHHSSCVFLCVCVDSVNAARAGICYKICCAELLARAVHRTLEPAPCPSLPYPPANGAGLRIRPPIYARGHVLMPARAAPTKEHAVRRSTSNITASTLSARTSRPIRKRASSSTPSLYAPLSWPFDRSVGVERVGCCSAHAHKRSTTHRLKSGWTPAVASWNSTSKGCVHSARPHGRRRPLLRAGTMCGPFLPFRANADVAGSFSPRCG